MATTFVAVEVERGPLKFECAIACGPRLFAGTSDGTLAIYGPSAASRDSYEIVELRKAFAPRAIAQLAVREDLSLLLVLCDGLVHVHALGDLHRISTVVTLRGCATLALTQRSDGGECLLAMSCRRKVHVLRWAAVAGAFVDVAEVGVPDGPSDGSGAGPISSNLKAAVSQLTDAVGSSSLLGGGDGDGSAALATLLLWLSDGAGAAELVIGTRHEYLRFEPVSRDLRPLFRTGRGVGAAVGARLSCREVLLCQDRIGCFVGTGGAPSRKYVLSFREPPLLVCATPPYVLSLQPARGAAAAGGGPAAGAAGAAGAGGSIEIRLLQTQDVLQTLPLAAAAAGGSVGASALFLQRADPPPAAAAAQASAEVPGSVVFLNGGRVTVLRPRALRALQLALLLARRYEDAARLCESVHGAGTPAEARARRALCQLHGYAQLHRGSYGAGVELLLEHGARPRALLSLYPKLLPAGMGAERVTLALDGDEPCGVDGAAEPADEAEAAADGSGGGGHGGGGGGGNGNGDHGIVVCAGGGGGGDGDELEDGGGGRAGGGRAAVLRVRRLAPASQAQTVQLYTALRGFLERARRRPELLPAEPLAAGAHALTAAAQNSNSAPQPQRPSREAAGAELAAADSALLKILLSIDQPAVLPFLRGPNWCVLAEAESILLRYRQLDELVGLWHGRALHAKALALLASLGQQADDAPAARPPPALVAPPALRGPAATIDYLCRLGASDLDLIFEFAQWPLRATPTDALRIFAEPPAARGGSGGGRRGGALPAERVFDYVRAQQGRELALELVERWLAAPAAAGARATATEPAVPARLHDELASSQLQAIARLCALIVDAPADAADAAAGAEAAARAPARAGAEFQKADGALADASAPAAAEGVAQERARAAAAVASARAELAGLRARCEPFLRSSLALNADALLRALCAGASAPLLCALAPERALLLRTLGRHEAALRLLVVEMSDLSAAMAYCEGVHADDEARARARAATTTAGSSGGEPLALAAAESGGARTASAYDSLVRVLLRPAAGCAAGVDAALALLRAHPDEIDSAAALELLPAGVPLASISDWLEGSLRALAQGARAAQIERNLAKTHSLTVRAELGKAKRTAVRIGAETLCAVCGKRVGTTVFARYPNGLVVHLVCSGDDLHVCPRTREDFRSRTGGS